MKNTKRHNQIIAGAIAILLIISMVTGTVVTVFADEIKIVTLGEDLSDEQRELMLNYFNVDETQVAIVEVNNKEEHEYLDGIASKQQIGTHTYSCTYLEPTNEGGIHIKTANLNWVTCEMIRNALVTSGITNCNVVCASPIEVSGTGALTGIFKAYDTETDTKLDDEKVKLASEELVQTMDIAETVGQELATEIVGDIKEQVITGELDNPEEVTEEVLNVLSDYGVELTDEQEDALIDLMTNIAKQDYSIDDVKKAYTDVMDTVNDVVTKANEAKGVLERITDWFRTTWQKITGTYDEVKNSDEVKEIQNQLGIIADTNDSLLGDDTVVTATEDEVITDNNENASDEKSTNNGSFLDKVKSFFKTLFGGETTDDIINTTEQVTDNKAETTVDKKTESTKDKTKNKKKSKESNENKDKADKNEDDNILDYVTYEDDTSIESSNTGSNSFDDLTK